jgi:hypothetical protein
LCADFRHFFFFQSLPGRASAPGFIASHRAERPLEGRPLRAFLYTQSRRTDDLSAIFFGARIAATALFHRASLLA